MNIDRMLAKLASAPHPKAVEDSVQAYQLVVGDVLYLDCNARVLSIRPLDDSALPMYEICARPLEGDAAHQRLIIRRVHSSSYVRRVLWYREQRDLFSAPDVLHLVSCASTKRSSASRAEDLYISPWFRAARAHVRGEPWCILSARHGLIHPNQTIEPYEDSLNGRSRAQRREWAARVLRDVPVARRYVIWAGAAYAEFLAPTLNAELPLHGLGIGEQLAWFKRHAQRREGMPS